MAHNQRGVCPCCGQRIWRSERTSPEEVERIFDVLIERIRAWGRDTSDTDAFRARLEERFGGRAARRRVG